MSTERPLSQRVGGSNVSLSSGRPGSRIQEVDFLRGLAILSVVFFHFPSIGYLNTIGYIGVDLFFVLSGYLISTLLLREFVRFGNVRPGLFLIRRGFKIYPLWYVFIVITVVGKLAYHDPINPIALVAELTFTRNYLPGLWVHTWSLCVEEQFYVGMAVAMLFVGRVALESRRVNVVFGLLFVSGIFVELVNVALQEGGIGEGYLFNAWARRVQSQYCFDSLLFGVFVAYNMMFNRTWLEQTLVRHSRPVALVSVLTVLVVPALKSPWFAPFRDAMIYVSFGALLLLFLVGVYSFDGIGSKLFRWPLLAVAKIGTYSYAIYLFHLVVRDFVVRKVPMFDGSSVAFVVYLVLSIVAGMVFSRLIEMPALRWRDRYYPARAKV